MYDFTPLFCFILIALAAFYWVKALRTKEIANKTAENYCAQMQVQFLDQTVFLKSIKFRRNARGQLGLLREYYFEFTVTGEDRYFGQVFMQGNRIESVNLDPHRLH